MTIIGRADKLLDPAEGRREQGRVWEEEGAGEGTGGGGGRGGYGRRRGQQGEKCGEMEDHCS